VLPDYLQLVFNLAKKNNKRVGPRIQMSAPDYWHQPALPDFVVDKVPTVELIPDEKEKKAAARGLCKIHIRVISPGSTILFFNRRSVNWSAF
jgi:hypothetical protein